MLARRLLSLVVLALEPAAALWPVPRQYTTGTTALFIHQNLEITYNGVPVCWRSSCYPDDLGTKNDLLAQLAYTYGYTPNNHQNSQQIVQAGVSRALSNIFHGNFVPWKLHPKNSISSFEPSFSKQAWIQSLAITQTADDQPRTFKPAAGQVDESYNLTLSTNGVVKITAVSSTGVLRGLETFSQLFYQHSQGPFWYTPYAPVSIQDSPKYQHRGVLLDVARSWYEVGDIKRTIDAISWNKMNRLHIHMTDSQSWPLEITSMPEVARQGAYRSDLTYSAADLQGIQEYGVARGVEVIVEIDMPGHIGSLSWSHPELIVAYDAFPYYWWCAEPPCGAFKLNNSNVESFLEKMFEDLLPRVAPYAAYFHTGGDELNANDSMLDPGVRSNSTAVLQPLLQAFIDRQHSRVRAAGLTPMCWEEIPLTWNVTLGNDTVVQTWLGTSSVATLTGQGRKVIDSNYNFWYLDCGRGQWLNFDNGAAFSAFYPFVDWCSPTKNWRLVYSHDPAAGLSPAQAELVLGGEVAIWSETIDPVTLDTLLWPRGSAAAEVLWSGNTDASGQNRSQLEVSPRLSEFRERMVARGVNAAPVQMIWCTQAANSTECSYPVGPGY